jgi:hypothetical protein
MGLKFAKYGAVVEDLGDGRDCQPFDEPKGAARA